MEDGRENSTDELISISYLKWSAAFLDEKIYHLLMDVPAGVPETNVVIEPCLPEVIKDMRGQESSFS